MALENPETLKHPLGILGPIWGLLGPIGALWVEGSSLEGSPINPMSILGSSQYGVQTISPFKDHVVLEVGSSGAPTRLEEILLVMIQTLHDLLYIQVTTRFPRVLVSKVMQDLYHQQCLQTLGSKIGLIYVYGAMQCCFVSFPLRLAFVALLVQKRPC